MHISSMKVDIVASWNSHCRATTSFGQLYFAFSPLFLLILFLYIFVSLEQKGEAAKELDKYVWWTVFLNSLGQLIEFEATVVDFAANGDASIIFSVVYILKRHRLHSKPSAATSNRQNVARSFEASGLFPFFLQQRLLIISFARDTSKCYDSRIVTKPP